MASSTLLFLLLIKNIKLVAIYIFSILKTAAAATIGLLKSYKCVMENKIIPS
jgi:hypothetical protein